MTKKSVPVSGKSSITGISVSVTYEIVEGDATYIGTKTFTRTPATSDDVVYASELLFGTVDPRETK